MSRWAGRGSGRFLIGTMGVVALVAMASCSSSDGSAASESDKDRPSTTTTDTKSGAKDGAANKGEVPWFTGTDAEFYVPPSPLPEAKPGTLIRAMRVSDADGEATVKLMYHSRDAANRDVPVTAIATYPTTDAPKDGWPIVATAPGTVGVAAQCGVTHQATEAPDWGVQGVRVMTDYVGLGAQIGRLHPYLSKPSEGHSVLDSVRSVRHLPDAHAGDRWLSVGHSQGGHGALSASELSAEYAPELDLLGTLALAPAAMLDKVYGGIDPIVSGILTVMTLYGAADEHPEIKVDDYVTPELAAASGVLHSGCLDQITADLIPVALAGKLFTADPRQTEPVRSILLPNDVGTVKVDAPLFLVSGTKDDRVVIERVHDLYQRLCATGQVTELLIIDGADHQAIIPDTATRTAAWLNARLAGEAPTNSCNGPMPTPVAPEPAK
ncbi:MAG TPA: lipase family protein [Microthrixaceae bacterium]|nr:lipase family protein [Microthrixaceae bacterium]